MDTSGDGSLSCAEFCTSIKRLVRGSRRRVGRAGANLGRRGPRGVTLRYRAQSCLNAAVGFKPPAPSDRWQLLCLETAGPYGVSEGKEKDLYVSVWFAIHLH